MNFCNIQINTPRLSIRSIRPEDYPEIYPCITTSLAKYMSWDTVENFDEFLNIANSWQQNMQTEKERLIVTIRHIEDGRFIGLTGLHECKTQLPALGIWVSENEHQQGFGREAVHAIIAWASQHMAELDISGFLYPVAIENTASRKIATTAHGTLINYTKEKKFLSLTYYIPLQKNLISVY